MISACVEKKMLVGFSTHTFFQLFLDIWFGYCEIADVFSVQHQPELCLHFFFLHGLE